MVLYISLPPLSEVRQRLRRSFVRPKLPTHQHILIAVFAICLVLFTRALGGYGQVKGHALVHCPLLSDGHKYLPIALMHEGKIAELNFKLKEEELMARVALKSDRERRAESVDEAPQEDGIVREGDPPAVNEVLVEEQIPENDIEPPAPSDAAATPTPPVLSEVTETPIADIDEAVYEADIKESTHDFGEDESTLDESTFDEGVAGPLLSEDSDEVLADDADQILD